MSFRSTGAVDVNRLARVYGGGGHAKAAGALIPGALAVVRAQVLADALGYLRDGRVPGEGAGETGVTA